MKNKITITALLLCLVTGVTISSTGCAGDRYSRSTGEYIDDKSITTRIKSALLADKEISSLDVKVKTYERVVQLSGFVDSEAQRTRAEEIARNTKGVQSVKNDMVVKTVTRP